MGGGWVSVYFFLCLLVIFGNVDFIDVLLPDNPARPAVSSRAVSADSSPMQIMNFVLIFCPNIIRASPKRGDRSAKKTYVSNIPKNNVIHCIFFSERSLVPRCGFFILSLKYDNNSRRRPLRQTWCWLSRWLLANGEHA